MGDIRTRYCIARWGRGDSTEPFVIDKQRIWLLNTVHLWVLWATLNPNTVQGVKCQTLLVLVLKLPPMDIFGGPSNILSDRNNQKQLVTFKYRVKKNHVCFCFQNKSLILTFLPKTQNFAMTDEFTIYCGLRAICFFEWRLYEYWIFSKASVHACWKHTILTIATL